MTDNNGTGARDGTGLEKILAEHELSLRQVIDSMPHMVWVTTPDGNCIFLSKLWEEYTGIAATEQLGTSWTTQLHNEDWPLVRTAWDQAVATDTNFQVHCRMRRFDGSYRWFDTRGLPLRDPQGRIVTWFGTSTDVHDGYEARHQLVEREKRLGYVALATHDSIYDWDVRNGVTYRNEQYQALFDAPALAKDSEQWWANKVHPDDRLRVLASAAAAFNAHLPVWSEEYRLRRRDGTYAFVKDRAYLLYNTDDKLQRMIGAIADETARKNAEQSLRDAQARLVSAMQAGGLATWIWDVPSDVVHWDESAYQLWDQRPEYVGDLSMKKVASFVHPDDAALVAETIERFFRTGIDTRLEFRTARPDGTLQWLLAQGQAVRDEAGQPVRMAGVYIDITGRKQIEQTLRDSQARLKSALHAGGLATWTWDIVANDFIWDEDTWRLWGRRPDESGKLSYAKIFEMVHPDDRPRLVAANEVFLSSGALLNIEFRTLRPDGALQWLTISGQVERDAEGKPARMSGVFLDITERKQVEQSLRDTQARLKSAMQAAGLATWIWDMERDEIYWDDDAFRLWGRTPGEFDKLSFQRVIDMMHPDDRTAVVATDDRFRRSGIDVPVEFRVLRPDNALQWLVAKGQVERNDQGKPSRVVGVYLDITERKRAEDARLNSQKMEALGTLAGGIAHDFNNILLAITGNASLASADIRAALPQDHSIQRNLHEIEKSAKRAAELVKRILTFSRQQDTHREVVLLQPLIDDAVRLLRPTLRAAISIRTALAADTAPVISESIQIQQVVMNLVTNAAHAIGDKPGVIDICLQNSEFHNVAMLATGPLPAGRYVCLSVGDSGGGIDAAVIERIFEPFFTTKQPGQGTGLGLAVVHGIAQAHGGAIGVETQPGCGTTFRVYFPAASGDIQQADAKTLAQPMARGEHVLYVDDEEPLVFLISRVLERLGYRVTGCVDPEQALRELRNHPQNFDVVVTDLSMRGMNGFELTRAVKTIRAELPVLLTSGYLRSEDRELAAQLGIRELILKPNTVDELGQAIDRTLSKLR